MTFMAEGIKPCPDVIYVYGVDRLVVSRADVSNRRKASGENKPELSAKSENASVPDLAVTNNGIEIKMWMKCNETSCVLDLERSGMYDTFNDLSDCETSVRVKCRGEEYSVPTPLTVLFSVLQKYVIQVRTTVLIHG